MEPRKQAASCSTKRSVEIMEIREQILQMLDRMTDEELILFRDEIKAILRNRASEALHPPEDHPRGQ